MGLKYDEWVKISPFWKSFIEELNYFYRFVFKLNLAMTKILQTLQSID